MPGEGLRKGLAKAKVDAEIERQLLEEKKQCYDEYDRAKSLENWKNWDAALEAYASGWRPPEPRFYVIISPESPVSTPEKLQEIAKMASDLTLLDTTYTGIHGDDSGAAQMQQDGKPQKVRVGEVSWEELQEVRSKTQYNMHTCVWIKEKVRGVVLVKSLASEGGHE
ncbi:hypothetical protein LA080_000094 [Diaporthe eres]|uniref:Uncharacterized protein n=1 Tax=Diaporthe vaccinii TaxID=105482 RepID=A0ABR4EVW2_9PEZI|nr:hypothetical protein LA080_000094 [Diaporthe eres]